MNSVVITGQRHVTLVLGSSNTVTLRASAPGPAVIAEVGKVGPAGRDGTGSVFTYVQELPSDTWNINHNLGFIPGGVFITDIDGFDCIGEIEHTDNNTTIVSFSEPIAGTAHLS
jgi:hypothetical protein